MKASVVDLRYRMKDVLRALARNENVEVYWRGKLKGIIKPTQVKNVRPMKEHPVFGMNRNLAGSVEKQMEDLRGTRYRDI